MIFMLDKFGRALPSVNETQAEDLIKQGAAVRIREMPDAIKLLCAADNEHESALTGRKIVWTFFITAIGVFFIAAAGLVVSGDSSYGMYLAALDLAALLIALTARPAHLRKKRAKYFRLNQQNET